MLTHPAPYRAVSQRAEQLVTQLEAGLQNGSVTTQSQLLAELLDLLGQVQDLGTGPSMEVPAMGRDDLLIREQVSRPLDQANSDLENVLSQVEGLRALTLQIFNLCQAERLGLGQSLAELTSLVDSYRLWVSDSDPSFVWAGDHFNDGAQVDPASTAFLDPRGGVVTLQPVSVTDLTPNLVEVTLDRQLSQGGLPGNNLEVRGPGQPAFTGARKEPIPLLYSDTDPRSDRITSLFDNRPDTLFEWERNYIDPTQPVLRADEALVYDPSGKTPYQSIKKTVLGVFHTSHKGGLQIPSLPNWSCFRYWPGDEQPDTGLAQQGFPLAFFEPEDRIPLKLGINLTLDRPRPISWMQLVPLIRGTAYPQVDQILVSADGQRWRALLSTPTVLNPRINRGVDFSRLTDQASNFEGVGVWPFPATPIRYVKLLLSQSKSYPAPLGLAHRFALGGKGPWRQPGPVPVVGSPASVGDSPAPTDFSASAVASQQGVRVAYDLLAGERQAISLRDLGLESRQYAAQSVLLSKAFPLTRPVISVALLVSAQIPEEWPAAAPDGAAWIRFEVSPDGSSWQPILPQSTTLARSVVRFDAPASQLYFRATLLRPEDQPSSSSVLRAYSLKAIPSV